MSVTYGGPTPCDHPDNGGGPLPTPQPAHNISNIYMYIYKHIHINLTYICIYLIFYFIFLGLQEPLWLQPTVNPFHAADLPWGATAYATANPALATTYQRPAQPQTNPRTPWWLQWGFGGCRKFCIIIYYFFYILYLNNI